jgi:hypothetical protein
MKKPDSGGSWHKKLENVGEKAFSWRTQDIML